MDSIKSLKLFDNCCIIEVKGFLANWQIKEFNEPSTNTISYGVKLKGERDFCHVYATLERASAAIRIAEERGHQIHPEKPLKNCDIWADYGVLWVDDITGNYYL